MDPKYFDSLNGLMAIVDEGIASKLWSEYRWGSFTKDFRSTVEKVTKVVAERSDLLKSAAYSQDIIADCTWCISSKEFPIAHPREVYRLLGYV